MNSLELPAIAELRRLPSPVSTPQALAWAQDGLWVSSRDERRLVCLDPRTFTVREEASTPGIAWAAASAGEWLYLTLGEGAEDDRYTRRFAPGSGFDGSYRIAQPDFTGSYLSHDGHSLYLSQWYKHRVLQLDAAGGIVREIPIGAEICGHTLVDGLLYVLRGTEQDGESWQLARLDPRAEHPDVEDLARVPFACRSLAFDGTNFWTNHRAANETVSFSLPGL